MNCTACGTTIGPGARFCTGCGAALQAPVPSAFVPPGDPPGPVPAPPAQDRHLSGHSPPPWVQPASEPPGRRRRTGRILAAVAVTTVALAGLGFVAVRGPSWLSAGGASDPKAAVSDLAGAVTRGDVLRALKLVAPGELRAADKAYQAFTKAAGEGVLIDPAKPLAGLDLAVEGLELEVDELADDVAKVTVRQGRATARFDPVALTERSRKLLGDNAREPQTETITAAELTFRSPDGPVEPFLMVIRRSNRWYVSPSYTLAEYGRLSVGDGPAPDLSPRPGGNSRGSASPEEAVRSLAEALVEVRIPDAIDGIVPAESDALHAYRPLLDRTVAGAAAQFRNQATVTIDDIRTRVERKGDDTWVVVTGARGTFEGRDPYCGQYGYGSCNRAGISSTWNLDGLCLSVGGGPEASSGCVNELLAEAGLGHADLRDLRLLVVQEKGRWYVSVVGSVLRRHRPGRRGYGRALRRPGHLQAHPPGRRPLHYRRPHPAHRGGGLPGPERRIPADSGRPGGCRLPVRTVPRPDHVGGRIVGASIVDPGCGHRSLRRSRHLTADTAIARGRAIALLPAGLEMDGVGLRVGLAQAGLGRQAGQGGSHANGNVDGLAQFVPGRPGRGPRERVGRPGREQLGLPGRAAQAGRDG